MSTDTTLLHLTDADIGGLDLDLGSVRHAIDRAFLAHSQGLLRTEPKTSMFIGAGHAFQSLVAVDTQSGFAALKWVAMVPPGGAADVNINASILLSDAASGQLRCLMDGRRATALRTAGMPPRSSCSAIGCCSGERAVRRASRWTRAGRSFFALGFGAGGSGRGGRAGRAGRSGRSGRSPPGRGSRAPSRGGPPGRAPGAPERAPRSSRRPRGRSSSPRSAGSRALPVRLEVMGENSRSTPTTSIRGGS